MRSYIDKGGWVHCPLCGSKTRVKIRNDTVLINFPLYCPKCGRESLISMKQLNIGKSTEPHTEPDAKISAEPGTEPEICEDVKAST